MNTEHILKPKEIAIPCPNCGDINWASELHYSSTKAIKCKSGSIVSTLYGVCKKCAKNHSK